MTGKEGVISAFLTGFIFVVLWLTACENLPYNEGKIQSIRLERRRKMKKLLLILLTLLLCTGCAAKTAQENPNPADKKESITEEQPENTASLA